MDKCSGKVEAGLAKFIADCFRQYVKDYENLQALVSVWEGDSELDDLELNVEAINEKLNLPVLLISGHINAALLHVPWTKVTSYPTRFKARGIALTFKLRPGYEAMIVPALPDEEEMEENERREREAYVSTTLVTNICFEFEDISITLKHEATSLTLHLDFIKVDPVDSHWKSRFLIIDEKHLRVRMKMEIKGLQIRLEAEQSKEAPFPEPLINMKECLLKMSKDLMVPTSLKPYALRLALTTKKANISVVPAQIMLAIRFLNIIKQNMDIEQAMIAPKQDIYPQVHGEGSKWWSWLSFKMLGEPKPVKVDKSKPLSLSFAIYCTNLQFSFKLSPAEENVWKETAKLNIEGFSYELSRKYLCELTWDNQQIVFISIDLSSICNNEEDVMVNGSVSASINEELVNKPDTNFVFREWNDHLEYYKPEKLSKRGIIVIDVLQQQRYRENWCKVRKLTRTVINQMDVRINSQLSIFKEKIIHLYRRAQLTKPFFEPGSEDDIRAQLFLHGMSFKQAPDKLPIQEVNEAPKDPKDPKYPENPKLPGEPKRSERSKRPVEPKRSEGRKRLEESKRPENPNSLKDLKGLNDPFRLEVYC